jgi:hypothetical protein
VKGLASLEKTRHIVSIFISWSGETSRSYAAILADWIPLLVPATVFFSPAIEPGERSLRAIERALEECTYGIVCLTRSNLGSPWLNFEAGAMANALRVIADELNQPPVVPLLFGGLTPADVKTPLSIFFQMRPPDKASIYDVVRGINKSLCEQARPPLVLDALFHRLWPELENKLEHVQVDDDLQAQPKRDVNDMVSEILEIVRTLQRNVPSNIRTYLGRQKEQEIITAIVSRGLKAGIHIETGREYDVMVNNELIIEVKLFVRGAVNRPAYQQAQSLAETARSLAL